MAPRLLNGSFRGAWVCGYFLQRQKRSCPEQVRGAKSGTVGICLHLMRTAIFMQNLTCLFSKFVIRQIERFREPAQQQASLACSNRSEAKQQSQVVP
jgi:hypothetical protein